MKFISLNGNRMNKREKPTPVRANTRNRVFAWALTLALCLSLMPMAVLADFDDLAGYEWAATAIDYLVDNGIMNGTWRNL